MAGVFALVACFAISSADMQQRQERRQRATQQHTVEPEVDTWNALAKHVEKPLAALRQLPLLQLPRLQLPSFDKLPSLHSLFQLPRSSPASLSSYGPLESPSDVIDFVQDATSSGGGWLLKLQRNGVRVWRRSVGESRYAEIRANGLLHASPREVIAALRRSDEEAVRKINPMFDSGYDLQVLDADTRVSYSKLRAVFPFKPRDTVTRVAIVDLPHLQPTAGKAILHNAVEHPEMPPRRGYVRAKILQGMLLAQAVPHRPGMTNFTFFSQTNAGGIIPAWLSAAFFEPNAVVFVNRIGAAAKSVKSRKKLAS